MNTVKISDAMVTALNMARGYRDSAGMVGYGTVVLRDSDGIVAVEMPFANKITDYGDQYHAQTIALKANGSATAITGLTGMQIGSGTTAIAKSGAGAAMVTLLAGQAFDSTYPQAFNLGAGLGWQTRYITTFAAGTGTGSVNEATLTNGTIGSASTTANTVARIVLGSTVTKAATDSLTITWNVTFLG